LSLPIFDTTLVVFSRLRRGINPLTNPGRDHVSHRLVSLGLSQRQAVVSLYAICGALGVVGVLIMFSNLAVAYGLGAAVFLAGLVGLFLLEGLPAAGGTRGAGA